MKGTSLLGLYTPTLRCSSFSLKMSLYDTLNWQFHMLRVYSLSVREKMASTSPVWRRSGPFSNCQRAMRAKPCYREKKY